MTLDPMKPVAAFIEYTLKPVLEDLRELVELMESKGFKRGDVYLACHIFIFQVIMDFLKSLTVTALICYTLFYVLSHSPTFAQ